MQARLALAHGRPVFLLDALVEQQAWAREFATRPGAHVVRYRPRSRTRRALLEPGALVA